jgi:hypothetical protein
MKTIGSVILGVACILVVNVVFAAENGCDKTCLERLAEDYRVAYLQHDPSKAPIAKNVRFTENSVEMPFPDASWDTVSKDLGPVLIISDPVSGQVAISTAIMQMNDTPGFITMRLKVEGGKITEIEHIISTKRNLSSPPTPFGDAKTFTHAPGMADIIPKAEGASRERMITIGDGYFKTLQRNNGKLHTRFAPNANRRENGLFFGDIEKDFRLGRYLFNNKVRRQPVLIDEARGIILFRGFIDHKGNLDTYKYTDGEVHKCIFREPQSWALLEMFKIRNEAIASVEATFIAAPYNMHSPWSEELNP